MVDVRREKELLYPCGLVWVSPGLFAGAYSLGPPVPLSLRSCAMAPMVKATKPTATAAATFVSIDSFIVFHIVSNTLANWPASAASGLRLLAKTRTKEAQ